MYRYFLIIVLIINVLRVSAQHAVSGFVDLEHPEEWETDVRLSKLSIDNLKGENNGTPVAIARINEDGSFAFNKKYISDSDHLYRLSIDRIKKVMNDSIKTEVDFIHSNTGFIRFKKSKALFTSFTTTNKAQLEWEKLQQFEADLSGQYNSEDESIASHKGFVKDSLQILLVKLIGIKQLENKKLLDKDIAENELYYLSLLSELKESDLNPSSYLFLEKKLAYLNNVALEKELQQSRWMNLGLFVLVLVLGFVTLRVKRKKQTVVVPDLSKQETTIQNLILQGKSNKEIANELFISLSTVKTHITNIYNKLNVANRQELLQKSTGAST
ncbi:MULTISPECIES: response regulator transcription factor [unclassified Flagellimonas]|uniref:response regulator transcription factor n=1 Tax=unclassified Flagellimonas TaxID=2644544 RepID=UPI00272EC22C|nr:MULTISPECIES: LuxR C-terminal-related transcriptional regulator [unclassified Flagellimonas]